MKKRWVIRPPADFDINYYANLIAEANRPAAHRFLEAVINTIDDLSIYPGFGTRVEDAPLNDLRRWRVKGFDNYIILYRDMPDRIIVIALVHASRDMDAILRKLTDAP